MGRVITPIDWAVVPRSFHVMVSAHPSEPALELRVMTLEAFVAAGLNGTPDVVAPCIATQDPTLRHCAVDRCRSDGKYVMLLVEVGTEKATISGVMVSERHGWDWRGRRLPGRNPRPRAADSKRPGPAFSIITTVYDIEPYMLGEAADSVLDQSLRDFEWLVLDNGSRLRSTSRAVDALALRDSRIRVFRVDDNLHIVRGNRYLLERARGNYVLPMDADDLLHRQALAWLARAARESGGAALVFGDEEKVDAMGEPMEPIGRGAWSRVAAMGTVPCAHPTAFRRETALALGVYTDDRTRGSHDWDTALRFADGGYHGIHAPALLYGWRVHGSSTSLSATTKDYIGSSQQRVVESSLERRGLRHLYDIRETAAGAGFFHLMRRKVEHGAVSLLLRARGRSNDEMENLLATLRTTSYPVACVVVAHAPGALNPLARGAFIEAAEFARLPRPAFVELPPSGEAAALAQPGWNGHAAIVDGSFRVTGEDWIWDALGALQLDEQVGWVGGRIEDRQGHILHLGLVAGVDGGTPHYLQSHADVRWLHVLVRHRAVSGVHCGFTVVRDRAAAALGLPYRANDTVASDVAWTRAAHRQGWIAAFAPAMTAVRAGPFEDPSAAVAMPPNPGVCPQLPGIDPYYPRYFSRRAGEYALPAPEDRIRGLLAWWQQLRGTA